MPVHPGTCHLVLRIADFVLTEYGHLPDVYMYVSLEVTMPRERDFFAASHAIVNIF